MKVNEIFESIQGEGKYAGYPVLFIRLSGCTRECDFCDTKYHKEGKEMRITEIAKKINESDKKIVVWTGGEPLLQVNEIKQVIDSTDQMFHHLETNGDIHGWYHIFNYVCISPKSYQSAQEAVKERQTTDVKIDIKIVTDTIFNSELIPYATMLMPLTVNDRRVDNNREKKVWEYCVKNNIRFCLRQHIKVWGNEKGV